MWDPSRGLAEVVRGGAIPGAEWPERRALGREQPGRRRQQWPQDRPRQVDGAE